MLTTALTVLVWILAIGAGLGLVIWIVAMLAVLFSTK